VITCSRCGTAIAADLKYCPQCGMSINGAYAGETGSEVNTQGQEQPELPAWLESLRAGEGQNATPSGPAPFPVERITNHDELPGWLRPAQPDAADATSSGSFPFQRPAASPAPNTDDALMMGSMSASSLIDEQSLPSWMREQQGTPASLHENISASSLVQPDALPEWMRTAPLPVPPTPVQQQGPIVPQAVPSEPIAGNDLVNPQILPQWMTNGQPGIPTQGQHGFSASSLIDANALPSWMRESSQASQQGSQVPQPASSSQTPMPNRQDERMQGGLAAASFIDMNALPDWLRSPEEQRQQGHPLQPQRYSVNPPYQVPAPFANAGRPDALHPPVPSRPRSGMGIQEESEVAANVFASMLGVAAAAPYLPGQAQQGVQGEWQAAQQPQVHQHMVPPSLSPRPSSGTGSSTQAIPQGPDSISGMTGMANQGAYQGSSQNSMYGAMPQWQGNGPSSYPGSTGMNMGEYPANRQGMLPSSPENMLGSAQEQVKPQSKPAKRSIFEAIRDWLSRN
jgi:hypothetical protein